MHAGGARRATPLSFVRVRQSSCGTVLLVCSLRTNGSHFGVAVAPSGNGPCRWKAIARIFGEDAFVWRQPADGSFHMPFHTTV